MTRQEYKEKLERGIAQLQLPGPADAELHLRLLLEGRGIHAENGFTALFPDGWHDIALEVSWEPVAGVRGNTPLTMGE